MLQREGEVPYWRATHYAVDGNLQAALDEFAHLLWEPERRPNPGTCLPATSRALPLLRSPPRRRRSIPITTASVPTASPDQSGAALRAHFALRYGNVHSSNQAQAAREDAVRDACIFPCHPFILTSTSAATKASTFIIQRREDVTRKLQTNDRVRRSIEPTASVGAQACNTGAAALADDTTRAAAGLCRDSLYGRWPSDGR